MKYITVCLSIFMISACKEKNNDLSQKPADSVEVERNEAVKDSLKAQKEIVSVKSQHDKGKEWLERDKTDEGESKARPVVHPFLRRFPWPTQPPLTPTQAPFSKRRTVVKP